MKTYYTVEILTPDSIVYRRKRVHWEDLHTLKYFDEISTSRDEKGVVLKINRFTPEELQQKAITFARECTGGGIRVFLITHKDGKHSVHEVKK